MELDVFFDARNGNQDAICKLIKNYDPTMEKFAKSLCATAEDAEDSHQHARIVISQKLNTFNQMAKITTWLFAIIKNECYRLQKKMLGFSIHGPPESAWLDKNDLEVQYQNKQLLDRVSTTLAQLDSEDIEIVLLKDFEDLSIAEISEKLQITDSAVKSRLHRSRSKLKHLLLKQKIITS